MSHKNLLVFQARNQKTYCNSLQEIQVEIGKDNNRPLTALEFKEFRGAIGKLSWLQESTRPDLSYNTLSLSKKNRCATVGDIKKMNEVIRKAIEGTDETDGCGQQGGSGKIHMGGG